MKLSNRFARSFGMPKFMPKAFWSWVLGLSLLGCGMRTDMQNMAGDEGMGGWVTQTGGDDPSGGGHANTGGARTGGFIPGSGGGNYTTGGAYPTGGNRGTGGVRTGGLTPGSGGWIIYTGGAYPTGGNYGMGGVRTGGFLIPSGGGVRVGGNPGTGGGVITGGIRNGGYAITGGFYGTGGLIMTGGRFGSGGVPSTGGICPNIVSFPDDLIDDMNDGNAYIPTTNGRSGAWRTTNDGSPGSAMFPEPNTAFTMTKTSDTCHLAAAYVKGSGAVLWGSSVTCGIGSPYNASGYTGISVWAKSDLGPEVIRVSIPTKDTLPDGGICQPSVASGAIACYDHYGYRITIDSEWKKYTIPFSSLVQDGWGKKDYFDAKAIYQVLFQIPTGANYAFWIDDLAFLGQLPILP